MARDAALARLVWKRLEPIHAVTYFSPEARAAFSDAGYKGFWMGYFAGRAAPLGEASPEVVCATFYNFSLAHIRRALPDAWTFAPPSAALEARQRGSVSALRRAFASGFGEQVDAAASLARMAAESAPLEGRALFAANRALPWPEGPDACLWHACTLLREHRGDGHIAALVAAGVVGREANVMQTAAGIVPREVFEVARHYDEEEWERVSSDLSARGLIDRDGKLTDHGVAIREEVESRTDLLALSAYECLDDRELQLLAESLLPLARAVIKAGDLPPVTPIGEQLDP